MPERPRDETAAPSFEHLSSFLALVEAAERARRGTHGVDAGRFWLELEPEVLRLSRELRDESYRPGPYRSFEITDPKPRTISAAPFRDRVVHHALCAEIEPVLERGAAEDSFACRRGKGSSAALNHVRRLVRLQPYFLKLDVRHFFETLRHDVLLRLLRRRVGDPKIIALVARFVVAGAPGSSPGRGVPIGNLTSQHFANFYLGPLDRHAKAGLRAPGYCRYMDDVLLFGPDARTLWRWHASVESFVRDRLGVELKAEVTRVAPTADGVSFLGFRVFRGLVRLDAVRRRRFHHRLRAVDAGLASGALSEQDACCSAGSLVAWARQGHTRGLGRSLVFGPG